MKKVAFVVSSLDTGGAQRAVSNIVTNWPEEWDIDIILNNAGVIKYPYQGNIIDLQIPEPKDRKSIIYQMRVFVKRLLYINRLKKKNKYDACISFLDSANIVNILTKKRKMKTIVSVRCELSQDKTFAYKYILTPLVKLLYNQADKIVALSKGVEWDLVNNFKLKSEKNCTIYNCYDLSVMQRFANIEERKVGSNKDSEISFVTMGRLTNQKGQWHLIRAFSQLLKDGHKCRLILLGEGELRGYFEKLIRDYGIEEQVELTGFVDNPFVRLKEATCFVFPSLYEGFGNALIEALACDLPIISADFKSGAREILAPETDISYHVTDDIEYAEYGILVPVCDGVYYDASDKLTKEETVLYNAMLNVIKDDKLREMYGEKAHLCVERFKPDYIIEQWLELIG